MLIFLGIPNVKSNDERDININGRAEEIEGGAKSPFKGWIASSQVDK